MFDRVAAIEHPVHISYKDLETFDFQLLLDQNIYANINSLHICFPMKFKKERNMALNLENDVIIINKFFAHWIKDIYSVPQNPWSSNNILIRC